MMKKRSVAMAMAAVTVAAPVAQMAVASTAFAAETNTVTASEAVKKVEEYLKVTYSDPREDGKTVSKTDASISGNEYMNSIYEVVATVGTVGTVIKNGEQLADLIEKAQLNNSKVTVTVVDKGHREDGTKIVATELTKVDRYQVDKGIYNTIDGTAKDLYAVYKAYIGSNNETSSDVPEVEAKFETDKNSAINGTDEKHKMYIKSVEALDAKGKPGATDTTTAKVVITLVNGKTIELTEGSAELDFTQPVDVNGNYVDMYRTGLSDYDAIAKSIVGFKQAKELDKVKEFDILNTLVETMIIDNNSTSINSNMDTYYNGAYTAEGKELINAFASRNAYKDGQKYNIVGAKVSSTLGAKDGVYSLVITAQAKKAVDNPTIDDSTFIENLSIVITGTDQTKMADLRDDIDTVIAYKGDLTSSSTGSNSQTGVQNKEELEKILSKLARYETIGGKTRFETAVAISESMAAADNENVVLVGYDAITDGLAAAPFAKEKKASILLTKKDEVPTVVMDQIKKVLKAGKDTVYIIGGKDVVSEKVEAQLLKELKDLNKNIKIERIAGTNRYETSVEIAKKMNLGTKAYVVGGFGEADAMSVAPLAAKELAPIIVSPQAGLTDSAKTLLEVENTVNDVKFIGGTGVVSSQAMADVKKVGEDRKNGGEIKIERIAGKDRKETNAKVLEKFGQLTATDKLLVAKDGMANKSHLVDALTAAVLGQPIVLNTNGLTTEQEVAIDKIDSDTPNETRATQVGLGVVSSVMDKIVALLGNTK